MRYSYRALLSLAIAIAAMLAVFALSYIPLAVLGWGLLALYGHLVFCVVYYRTGRGKRSG